MKIHKLATIVFLLLSAVGYSQTDSVSSGLQVFSKVDKEAAFPGGEQAWKKFLENNLNPNTPVDHGAPTGYYIVMVQFVVNTEGNVSDIKPLTSIGYGMEQEVLRILKKSGTWEPAMLNGKPVNAYRKQPVIFMVTEEGFDISPYSIVAGTDNEITIEADKVKNEDLYVTISRGTIKRNADGKFIARVNGASGRVIVKVYNAKKNNKEIGTASLEIKQPVASEIK
jgi:Gram-negative bacterial TonB protein C-terminal